MYLSRLIVFMISDGFVFAAASTLLYAIGNIPIRKLSQKYGSQIAGLLICGGGIVPPAMAALLLNNSITSYSLLLSIIAGIFLALGYLFFYKTLETELLSTSSVLFNIQPALLFLFGVLVLGEGITAFDVLGTIMVFAGVVMITFEDGLKINKPIVYGVLGNIFWVAYWVLFTYSTSQAQFPAVQLVINRVVGTVLILAAVFITGGLTRKIRKDSRLAAYGLGAGAINGLGVMSFAMIIVLSYLAIGSVITSLVPAIIAIFAFTVFKERPDRREIIGLVVAFVGAVMIAL